MAVLFTIGAERFTAPNIGFFGCGMAGTETASEAGAFLFKFKLAFVAAGEFVAGIPDDAPAVAGTGADTAVYVPEGVD